MRRFRLSHRTVIGLVLLALGIIFLFDTTDVWGRNINVVGTYWPVLLIAWGLWGIISNRFALKLWSCLLVAVGSVLLLSNLDLWDWGFGQLWPLLLVIVGLFMLFGNRSRRRRRRHRIRRTRQKVDADNSGTRGSDDTSGGFRASYIFGGGKERVTSQNFQGGQVSAIFGGVELDLRDAVLGSEEAVIEATVVCGGIELRVPKDWRVNIRTTTMFGGAENNRPQPSAADAKGELTITGTVVCGGIEVRD